MFSAIDKYLDKHSFPTPQIGQAPHTDLQAIIVIPAYHEENLLDTLSSLLNCNPGYQRVEVIIVINDSEASSDAVKNFHQEQVIEVGDWVKKMDASGSGDDPKEKIDFHVIYAHDLPKKKAGVGLARKIGMDEAARRWNILNKNGPIICLDADTLVADNYLAEVTNFFKNHPECPACNIRYEHPLEGLNVEEKKAIVSYELHLRYFLAAKKWTSFPYAFETIGSAMGVRAVPYAQQGGMNTRKAGEDFYFLNKFIPLNHFSTINTTCVFPSARISDRVPFGTGRAIGDMLEGKKEWRTYPPLAFQILKRFFAQLSNFYKEPNHWKDQINDPVIVEYLEQKNFPEILKEIKANTSTFSAFEKRYFRWFDAFQIMKCLHYFEAAGMERVMVEKGAKWLLDEQEIDYKEESDAEGLLMIYRKNI